MLAVLGGAGYLYVPSLLKKIQDSGDATPTQAAPASKAGRAGPLGEVNEAMDVSDTLDSGGGVASRPDVSKLPPALAPKSAAPAGQAAATPTNTTNRARAKQPRQTAPGSPSRP